MASRSFFSASVWALAAVSLLLVHAQPLGAQLPDAFAAHFGASRTRELTRMKSGSLGIMLLSQYGSRWKDPSVYPPETVTDYDQLGTTVGYNYMSAGLQHSWLLSSCPCTLVGSASGILGVTSDRVTKAGQDGLHNYMRYPHVRRGNVAGPDWMLGGDFEVALWYSKYWNPVSLDLFVNVEATVGTHHGEQTAGGGFGLSLWMLRVQGSAQKAFWVDQSIVPGAVAASLKSGYWMASGLATIDRTRYGALLDVLPTIGGGLTYSSGLFPGETEMLLSVFLEFPGGSNNTWRIEHVNDVLNDKDRGPTGGLRVVYVAR